MDDAFESELYTQFVILIRKKNYLYEFKENSVSVYSPLK